MLWHSDGLETQEKLCERMAKMTSEFKIAKNRFNFFQSFLEIHNREWMGKLRTLSKIPLETVLF